MNEIKIITDNQSQKVTAEWGNLTWFANAALNNSDLMTIGRCIIKPGQCNPLHSHPNCYEVLVVISGEIEHMVENGSYTAMHPGDTIAIPSTIKHHARNSGTTDAVLFIAFSTGNRETKGE